MPLEESTLNQLVDTVRRFVNERLIPLEEQVANDDLIPSEIIEEMKQLGLFGLTIPTEYGGLGLNTYEECQVVLELGRTAPACRSIFGTNNGIGSQGLVMDGTQEQKDFYLVGGIWRAIARIYIQQKDYPIKIIDNLTINKQDAVAITEVISKLSRSSLKKITSVGRRRIDTLPIATVVLRRIIDKISPKRLIFSSYGIREGKFFEMLPRELMDQDPLISACEYYGFQAGRFSVSRDEVFSWVKVIFKDIDPREIRLIEAACLLGDIGWPEHPDYRAMHSFTRVLRLPIAGITHRERVLLALSIYHRYGGDEYGPEITITKN